MTRPPFALREQQDPVSSVDRALDILEVFNVETPALALGEVALRCGMRKSTVHKLLRRLVARRYVTQDPETRRYRLGLGAWTLGATAVSSLNVRQVALPQLRRLAKQTGEEVLLWVLDGGLAVCVERIHSDQHPLRTYTRIGSIKYPESLSAGRCLLAFAGPAEIDAAVQRVAAGGEANADRALRRRLEWIRSCAYDVNTGDLWPEIRAVSTAIRDRRGRAVASATISGPASRFDFAARGRALETLLDVGAEISTALGYQPGVGDGGGALSGSAVDVRQ